MFSLSIKYRQIYTAITLSLVVSFFIFLSISFFSLHTHLLQDGTQIVHSHIVKTNKTNKDTSNNHTHTKEELDSYYLASIFNKGLLSNVVVFLTILLLFVSIVKEVLHKQQIGHYNLFYLRGPPNYSTK